MCSGWRAREVKMPFEVKFHSLAEQLIKPTFVHNHMADDEMLELLHAFWRAIYRFDNLVCL